MGKNLPCNCYSKQNENAEKKCEGEETLKVASIGISLLAVKSETEFMTQITN